ncbi:MAG: hypothetical protein A2147_05605 [Chloroflexi bacterium RBG_16_57_8]|nr:MAG: hypothetical protein A2147_05605 [Chloroflexi bacterium RBG_16_57_8]
MRYRKFGNLDWDVSVLGFGAAGLPLDDEAECVGLIRYAIDRGLNYVNLGLPPDPTHHARTLRLVGRALRDGYRDRVKIAVSLPSRLINSLADYDRYLDRLTDSLEVKSVDFLLLGGLTRETWPRLHQIGVLRWAEDAWEDGRIWRLGFSFHDDYQTLRGILNAYGDWAIAEFRYSFMDVEHLPGLTGLQLAAGKGLGVIASQPLLSGRLERHLPDPISALWQSVGKQRTPAEWGQRWVWNHSEISTVVVDMSSMEQVKDYVALADTAEAGSMSIPEEILISRVRDAYRKLRPVPCTACRSCLPCPQGIDIPRVFELWNEAVMYGDPDIPRTIYRIEQHFIEDCNECGICVQRCGMMIDVPDRLNEALEYLAGNS